MQTLLVEVLWKTRENSQATTHIIQIIQNYTRLSFLEMPDNCKSFLLNLIPFIYKFNAIMKLRESVKFQNEKQRPKSEGN